MSPTTVTIGEERIPESSPSDFGVWMVAGFAQRGRTDAPNFISSITHKEQVMGPRTAETAVLHDSLETFFRLGGRYAHVGRLVGEDAEAATNDLMDDDDPAAVSLVVDAVTPGEWGNDIDVDVTKTGSTYEIVVKYQDSVVEESPVLSTQGEAVAWAEENSNYVRFTIGAGTIPVTQSVALAGGDSDASAVDADTYSAVLSQFTREYGYGTVSLPGLTSEGAHLAILDHVNTFPQRNGMLDHADTDDYSALVTAASGYRLVPGCRRSQSVWPWATIPGLAVGTTRTVPYSAVQAGLTAAALVRGKTPGDPIAGELGVADWVLGLTQENPEESQQRALESAGVSVAVNRRGTIKMDTNRTLSNPITDANWSQYSQARVVSCVAAVADEVVAQFDHRKINGRGFTLTDLEGEVVGQACLPFYENDDLYGETARDAFVVNTSDSVNPPTEVAAGKLRAQIALRTSPGADMVSIEIVKVPTTETI